MLATVTLIEGPNLFAPFAAVMVEAQCPQQTPTLDQLAEMLRQWLPPELLAQISPTLPDGRFETVAAALANAIQNGFGAHDLPQLADRLPDGRCRVMLGYLDPGAAVVALRTALDVTAAMFAQVAGERIDAPGLMSRLHGAVEQMRVRMPDPIARALIRAARRRGIPVCPVAAASRVWLFGQGARGIAFFEAANQFDSLIGARLSRSKFHSNQLVTRLGFPGVRHGIAPDPIAATRLAREIGYPLVVKPVSGGKGIGVTAHITDDLALAAAFAEADRVSPGDVLVERFVAGEDHRLVVIGGRFAWGVRRSPASVIGDGTHTIEELMQIENRRRAQSPSADIGPGLLELDGEVFSVLASQGLTQAHRPDAGVAVALRRIANIARGGTLTDCTDSVHPDVRNMAEAIARSFRLDVMGLDFMTPDITRSWRDVDCAVLEVNATPGFSSDARAELILDTKFPNRDTGRIPTVLLAGVAPERVDVMAAELRAAGLSVGQTDSVQTSLGGEPRMTTRATLGARVTALVLDPACGALVVTTSPNEIERHGMPLERCNVVLLDAEAAIAAPIERLITSCADVVLRLPRDGSGDSAAIAAIRRLVDVDASR